MTIETASEIATAIQAIATSVALVAAGLWTYLLFVRRRQVLPRATISHEILFKILSDSHILARLSVEIKNTGEVLLSLKSSFAWLQQMKPWPAEMLRFISEGGKLPGEGQPEVSWPVIARTDLDWSDQRWEIEPGEIEVVNFDFIVPRTLEVIIAYSYLLNVSKRGGNVGWGCTSVHDVIAN